MAEGGRIEPGTLRTRPRTDGSIPDPQPPQPARWAGECPDCHARGTEPAHAPWHTGPYWAAQFRNSAPAEAQRQAVALLQEYVDAEREPDTDEWLLGYAALCRALHVAAAALLAELDREAIR